MGLADGVAWEKEHPPIEPISQNPKTPEGNRKPPLALIPGPALVQQAIAHKLGAVKYGPYNWRQVPAIEAMVYLNAALRHLHTFIDGEDIDAESLASHLGHVCACCNIVMDAQAVGNLHDDRPSKAPTSEILKSFTQQRSASEVSNG